MAVSGKFDLKTDDLHLCMKDLNPEMVTLLS